MSYVVGFELVHRFTQLRNANSMYVKKNRIARMKSNVFGSFPLSFQNVWNYSFFSFRPIYLKLYSHGHSGDKEGMRIGGAKDERHFKSEQD